MGLLRRPRRAALPIALAALLAAAPEAGRAEEDGEAAGSNGELIDGIAAQVGTDVVLLSEVMRASAPIEARLREAGASDADVAMLRAEVLQQLIDRKLIQLFARRAEIEVNELEIDETVASIASENKITTDQLRASVESQGMSWATYRSRIADEILQQKVLAGMVRPKVRVEDAEVRAYYDERFADQPTSGEEAHLQHIAVAAKGDKPADRAAACARVRSALARVRAGEDFLAVAREVSDGTPDLGYVALSSLAPWMAETVAGMRAGAISDAIELPMGCAALRLVDRREVQPVTFEQAQDRIRQTLFEQKFERELEAFLQRLRKQTYVQRKGVFAETASLDASTGARARVR